MIGYRVDHFFETRINLAGHFDAISAKAGSWCHDNEVEHTTPKALIETKGGRSMPSIIDAYGRHLRVGSGNKQRLYFTMEVVMVA